jgi:hypothetical protein
VVSAGPAAAYKLNRKSNLRGLLIKAILYTFPWVYYSTGHLDKPNPNFQIPYLHSEHGYRSGSPSPDKPCKSRDADNRTSCFFPVLLCQIDAKVNCVWSSQPSTLPIQTKMALPGIPSRLMIWLSNGEPRSARRLSRGIDIAVRSWCGFLPMTRLLMGGCNLPF